MGQGEWSDKFGARRRWDGLSHGPLAVTAGVGAYKQKKLPEKRVFQVIEQCIVSGGRSVVVRNAGAELNAGMVVCPACKTQCAGRRQILQQPAEGEAGKQMPPVRGGDTARKAASAEHAEHRFPRRALRCDKGRRLRMRREKTRRGGKKAHGFSVMLLAVCLMIAALPLSEFGGGGNMCQGTPAGRATKTRCSGAGRQARPPAIALNTRHSCCWATIVVESKAVEIDTYLFFTNDVVTRPQEEYTIRVRARLPHWKNSFCLPKI